jgi:hypothetical protein
MAKQEENKENDFKVEEFKKFEKSFKEFVEVFSPQGDSDKIKGVHAHGFGFDADVD